MHSSVQCGETNPHHCVLSSDNFSNGHSSVFRVSPLMPLPFQTHFYHSRVGSGHHFRSPSLDGFEFARTGCIVFSWAQFTSELGQMGLARFFSPVPFWEDRLADPKCCPFPGWEEMKHEGREGGEGLLPKSNRGKHTDVWWQLPERWVTVSLRFYSLSRSLASTSCHFSFSLGDKLEKSFGLFQGWKKSNSV